MPLIFDDVYLFHFSSLFLPFSTHSLRYELANAGFKVTIGLRRLLILGLRPPPSFLYFDRYALVLGPIPVIFAVFLS